MDSKIKNLNLLKFYPSIRRREKENGKMRKIYFYYLYRLCKITAFYYACDIDEVN